MIEKALEQNLGIILFLFDADTKTFLKSLRKTTQ